MLVRTLGRRAARQVQQHFSLGRRVPVHYASTAAGSGRSPQTPTGLSPELQQAAKLLENDLLGCVETADVNKAARLIEEAKAGGIPLDLRSYNTLLATYAEAGQWQKAVEILNGMQATGEQTVE